ncbi:26S proteasome regulatory subunit [Coemansia sp. RSA 376]|nr:26S proteasome regulatory subunit [Coemansia sp. S680]KAJ2046983.1 26S proteasome regulatory subunit [Coemansia sp. S16]KAJ2098497.1 26S proteasome regulatory subunit [Coemansia sp. S100]KAJ2108289.1 26S proteasome regulatory subunit [Coemansia sp. RSA 922]KAJ2111008.1 26S proteasome regulatory subunit [Coemansia sp. S142-1]KAJ2253356.1 26S proteasome regulatory subunit [Coemansia sp. RSA 455]KAJ2260279.1 26S proteasome regulatory subunit [Coemansia sp. RSA 376]KAJ2469548.1 26S proteasome
MEIDNAVTNYLQQQQREAPSELAHYFSEFEDLYERKIWHQLTKHVDTFINLPEAAAYRVSIYTEFVRDWQKHMNKVKLVLFALAAARQFDSIPAASEFMIKISEEVNKPDSQEAYALASLEGAHFRLLLNDLDSTRETLEKCEKMIQSFSHVEPVIYASFYRVCADYYKAKAVFGQYYKNALLLLACIDIQELGTEDRVQRAYDLSIAALLSDTIYNFGDLLSHPIIESLRDTEHAWMLTLLLAFNSGDIGKFESLVSKLHGQPLLKQQEPFLQQKIRLMALIESMFKRQGAGARAVSFGTISAETKLPAGEIEHLVMKALALGLIRGGIDQVEQVVTVQWVQPRYLGKGQIKDLVERLQQWEIRVKETALKMSQTTPELFA